MKKQNFNLLVIISLFLSVVAFTGMLCVVGMVEYKINMRSDSNEKNMENN